MKEPMILEAINLSALLDSNFFVEGPSPPHVREYHESVQTKKEIDRFKCRNCCSTFSTFSKLRHHIRRKLCKAERMNSSSSGLEDLFGCGRSISSRSSNSFDCSSSNVSESALSSFYRSQSPDENANYLSSTPPNKQLNKCLPGCTWEKQNSWNLSLHQSISNNPQLSSMKAIVKLARIDISLASRYHCSEQSPPPKLLDSQLSDLWSRLSCGLHDETLSDPEFYDETTTDSDPDVDVVTVIDEEKQEDGLSDVHNFKSTSDSSDQFSIDSNSIGSSFKKSSLQSKTPKLQDNVNDGDCQYFTFSPSSSDESKITQLPNDNDFFSCTFCTASFSTHLMYQIHRLQVHGR